MPRDASTFTAGTALHDIRTVCRRHLHICFTYAPPFGAGCGVARRQWRIRFAIVRCLAWLGNARPANSGRQKTPAALEVCAKDIHAGGAMRLSGILFGTGLLLLSADIATAMQTHRLPL